MPKEPRPLKCEMDLMARLQNAGGNWIWRDESMWQSDWWDAVKRLKARGIIETRTAREAPTGRPRTEVRLSRAR